MARFLRSLDNGEQERVQIGAYVDETTKRVIATRAEDDGVSEAEIVRRVLENGKLQDSSLGELPDPDFTMTLSYADSVAVQKGELDPNAGFMQGRMKVTGNMGKLMQLMPLTNPPEYKALQAEVRQVTDF